MKPIGRRRAAGPAPGRGAVGVGVVGCGRVARRWHLPALRGLDETHIAAIADRDLEALAAAGEQFGIERRYAGHSELLEDPAVQIVAVCVPASAHAEVAVAALGAGKHVLIEKPLALSIADCELIAEAAESAPGTAAVGFNLRHHRLVGQAAELARAGGLGSLELIRTVFTSPSHSRSDEPSWRWDRGRGGGVLLEQAIHHLDLWRFLSGQEPALVHALESGADQTSVVNAVTTGGLLISSQFCDATAPINEIELHGSEATARISCYRFDGFEVIPADDTSPRLAARAARLPSLARQLAQAAPNIRKGGDYVASYRAEWLDLLAAIETGGAPRATVADGTASVRTVLAALASASTGEPVRLADAPTQVPVPSAKVPS